MNRYNQWKKFSWRSLLVRVLLVVVTVALIVWALPHNERQRYKYDVGKPWMYGSFIAKFDFPVYKTDATIKAQEDSLLETFQPYYNYDKTVEAKMVQRFVDDYRNGIPGLPPVYVKVISNRLHMLYQRGIMDTPAYNEIYRDSTTEVRIVSGNKAQSIRLSEFYSTSSSSPTT